MIAEYLPLLKTHRLNIDLQLDGELLHVVVIPTLNEDIKLPDGERKVLEGAMTKCYDLSNFSNQEFTKDLNDYKQPLIAATTDLTELEKKLKGAVASKQKKVDAKKPAGKTTTTRKKKTQAEQREELRKKQAEKAEQQDLVLESEPDRLAKEEPKEEPKEESKELKSAVEKAEEKSLSLDDL